MPIRHLDYYLPERKLIQSASLGLLKDCRVGFEGHYWLRKILKSFPITAGRASVGSQQSPSSSNTQLASAKELDHILANVVGMGGSPPYATLKAILSKELELIKAQGITPFFVFNGLAVKRDKPFSTEDYRPSKREMGWDLYEQGRYDQAFDVWLKSNSLNQADYLHLVFKILHEEQVEFMRAPYSSWAQLCYLENHPKQYIHCIFAGSEILMWDIERVILGMDFESGQFTYLEKSRVLKDLGNISAENFADICILAGFDWIATFPPLVSSQGFSFKNAVDMGSNGSGIIHAYAEHPAVVHMNYIDLFFKTKFIIKYHLIMTVEGKVEPLNKETAPNDIHEFLGYRFPDQVYFYMCHGLVSPQVLNSLLTGALIESHPCCKSDSQEYINFIKSPQITDLRSQALTLLTYNLNPFYATRKVGSYFWFEPQIEVPMEFYTETPIYDRWRMDVSQDKGRSYPSVANTASWVVEAKKKQRVDQVDLKFCLRTVQALAKVASGGKDSGAIHPSILGNSQFPSNEQELQALLLVRFLELRHFTQQSQLITPYGQALLKGLTIPAAATVTNSNSDELVLALELIRMESLHSTPFHQKEGSNKKEDRHMTLISRVASLVPFVKTSFKPFPGPLHKDLLVFNGFVKSVHRSLRNALEMLLMTFLISELEPKKEIETVGLSNYLSHAFRMMFFSESGTGMGLVLREYLVQVLKFESAGSKPADAASKAKKFCVDTYGPVCHISDSCGGDIAKECEKVLMQQFTRACVFWTQVVEAVKVLNTGATGKEKELYDAFLEAEDWFKLRR